MVNVLVFCVALFADTNRLLDFAVTESRLVGTRYAIGIAFFDASSGLQSNVELIMRFDL